jgi:hypothetical protein
VDEARRLDTVDEAWSEEQLVRRPFPGVRLALLWWVVLQVSGFIAPEIMEGFGQTQVFVPCRDVFTTNRGFNKARGDTILVNNHSGTAAYGVQLSYRSVSHDLRSFMWTRLS